MAGIISNVDGDVQKLRKLKNEIENVKKALKDINITVDIDIAKGLQSQLTSLLGQYDALVDKIAAAEGKIILSVSRINKATEKIVQAQEKVSNPVDIPAQPGNVNTQANIAETASIQTQAKAYDDLRTEINNILGTRDANVKRMVEEMNAIHLINAEIKKITKLQGDASLLSSAQQKRLEQLNNSLLTHKAALSDVRQTLNNNVRLDNASATSMNGLSQSLSRMRVAYRELTEEERNSPFGKELLASINQADTKIKELDATIGNHQRNVGNYGKQWNGLSMSIQQVGRELPSLAYGPKVFFSAISNNLPILADEIKRTRIEYDLLKKSGQSATPVWKQVASSLFSWQTALTVGITLLTLYGDRLVKWISSLGKAEKAIKNLYTTQRDLYDVTSTGIEQSSKEITKLNSLYKIATDVTKSTKERNNAVKELKKSYPEHLKNLSNESIKNGEVSKAIKEQTNQIIANAKATVAADQIAKNWYKSFQAGVSKNIAYITKQRLEQELAAKEAAVQQLSQMRARPESYAGLAKEIEGIKDRIKETDREIATQENLQDSYQKSSKSLEKLVSVSGLGGKYEGTDKNYNSIVDQQNKIAELLDKQALEQKRTSEDLQNQTEQARINAMKDGSMKTIEQMKLNHAKEMQQLNRQQEDLLRKRIEDEKAKFDAKENEKFTKNPQYRKQTFDGSQITLSQSEKDAFANQKMYLDLKQVSETQAYLDKERQAWNEYLSEYGTFQQKKEAITKEYKDKIANATTEGNKKILQKQLEEALSSVDMDKLKQEINWELIFSDLNKVSKKSLEQVKQQLKTFKNSDEYKNMAVDQKKVIDEALNNIQSTIIDKGGLLGDLPEQLDALRIAQDELKQAQDEYNKSLKSGTDAEKEAALKKKNKAEKNVQNAETNVTRSADKTYQNLITLADTITQLGSSSEMSLSQIGSLASGLIDTFTEAGSKIGGIVGAVFSLLDGIEKQGFDGFVKNVFSSVFGAGASMWNTITFGGFNKLFGIGGNAKEVQDTIDRLTDRNETLQTAIEDLTDVMEASKGTKSVAAYTDAKKLQEETEENYKKIAQEQARYSNSHHSWNYYWGGFNQDEIARLSSQIGRNWNGDIWSLSPEEMKMLRSNVDMWEKIQNTGKGNYGGRLTEKLNDYIDQAGKMKELTNKLYEGLTGISFESMYDSFIDTLMDMDASAEDAADNIADYFMRAMLSNKIGELYSDKLEAWWKKFGKSMEDNELTESEREALQNEYMQYVEEAMKIRDEIAAATGYTGSSSSSSQETSKKGFATASQDSIDELNGRFTSLQIAGEEIKNQSVAQSQSLNILTMKADALISINTETRNIADDMRDLIASSYLELVQISENTGAIIKPIQQMQKDIAEVKNNTKGLSTK